MRLEFSYNLEKDAENFIAGTRAVNSKKPTPLTEIFIAQYGADFNKTTVMDFLRSYLEKENINTQEKILAITNGWDRVKNQYFERVEKIFDVRYPDIVLQVFLTTNSRSTYNIYDKADGSGHFFVYLNSQHPNVIIMHELLHFYTRYAVGQKLLKEISKERYNEINEALTVLLNVEFQDLLDGAEDKGYPQHQDLRATIAKLWLASRDLNSVLKEIV